MNAGMLPMYHTRFLVLHCRRTDGLAGPTGH